MSPDKAHGALVALLVTTACIFVPVMLYGTFFRVRDSARADRLKYWLLGSAVTLVLEILGLVLLELL